KDMSTAPEAVFTAARPVRSCPLIRLNLPPTYRVELVAARAVAGLLVLRVKSNVLIGAPVVRLRLATFCRATPPTVLKSPATKSFVPSGVASTALTPPPPKGGRKVVSISPVFGVSLARDA